VAGFIRPGRVFGHNNVIIKHGASQEQWEFDFNLLCDIDHIISRERKFSRVSESFNE